MIVCTFQNKSPCISGLFRIESLLCINVFFFLDIVGILVPKEQLKMIVYFSK